MFSLMVCVFLILILAALRMLNGALWVSKKAAGLALSTSGKAGKAVIGKAGGKAGRLGKSAVGITFGTAKSASDIAFGATRSGVKVLTWATRSLLLMFIPAGLAEFCVVAVIIATLSGGISAYATNVYTGLKKTKETSQVQAAASDNTDSKDGSAAGSFQSTDNPGIKDDEWKKASKWAKMTVNTALVIIQDDNLRYEQSTNKGKMDCAVFTITAVELGTGHTFTGKKITKYDPQDYFKNIEQRSKLDLQEYLPSYSQVSAYPEGSKGFIASGAQPSNPPSSVLPGDIFSNSVHSLMYAGHDKSGKIVLIESGGPGMQGYFKDLNRKATRTDMGIRPWDDNGSYTVMRPYVNME